MRTTLKLQERLSLLIPEQTILCLPLRERISLDSDEDGDLNVTIKTGKGKYKLFYAHLSNDVTYTCIQTEAKKENPYAYDIQFFPAKEVIENGIIDIKSSE